MANFQQSLIGEVPQKLHKLSTLWLGLVTTATYHSLEINLRIPVTVIQNNYVCCRQVNSQTTCSGAQHENKLGAVWHVEGIDL